MLDAFIIFISPVVSLNVLLLSKLFETAVCILQKIGTAANW